MRVRVYWNLHKRLFSVMAREGPNKGRVIEHARHVRLTNVTPKISEAGRQRVLKEKRKNVHAFLEGDRIEPFSFLAPPYYIVEYDPYRSGNFQTCGYVDHSMSAYFDSRYEAKLVSAPVVEVSVAGAHPYIRAQHPQLIYGV